MHITRKIIGAGFAAALFIAVPALAQQPAPAPISASHLSAAREVVELSGISKTYDLFYPQLAESMVQTLTRTRPEIRNDLIATLKALEAEFDKRDEEMVVTTARYFAGVMSEQALKETANFFKSEAGKQYVQMQPRVIDQMMAALDVWNRRMSEDLMSRVREEMKKKGHTIF